MEEKIKSFKAFYPFYLSEHKNVISRKLHFTGTLLFFMLIIAALVTKEWMLLIFCPIVGYGFAWVGHFFYEKNKPATFQYPFWSLASDFILFFELLFMKRGFKE